MLCRNPNMHIFNWCAFLISSVSGSDVIKHTYVGTKAILEGWKSGLFVNFCQFPCSWIRIRESKINAELCKSGTSINFMLKSNFLWRQILTRIRIRISWISRSGSGSGFALRWKAGSESALKPMLIRNADSKYLPTLSVKSHWIESGQRHGVQVSRSSADSSRQLQGRGTGPAHRLQDWLRWAGNLPAAHC